MAVKAIPFRVAYGDRSRHHPPQGGPSMTKQQFAQESNINFIVAKYRQTGLLEHVAKHKGEYGEFTQMDYHTALNALHAAQDMFNSIPADIRKEFNNDPGEFVAFASDPANQERIYELGLAERPYEPPAAPPVAPAPPEAPPAPEA